MLLYQLPFFTAPLWAGIYPAKVCLLLRGGLCRPATDLATPVTVIVTVPAKGEKKAPEGAKSFQNGQN
jgi:hypothetical protein